MDETNVSSVQEKKLGSTRPEPSKKCLAWPTSRVLNKNRPECNLQARFGLWASPFKSLACITECVFINRPKGSTLFSLCIWGYDIANVSHTSQNHAPLNHAPSMMCSLAKGIIAYLRTTVSNTFFQYTLLKSAGTICCCTWEMLPLPQLFWFATQEKKKNLDYLYWHIIRNKKVFERVLYMHMRRKIINVYLMI